MVIRAQKDLYGFRPRSLFCFICSHLAFLFLHILFRTMVDLEEYNGNFFEHSADEGLKEKEVQDRKDVADILKLQSELRLRMNYLEDANLFAADVHEETERFPEQAW